MAGAAAAAAAYEADCSRRAVLFLDLLHPLLFGPSSSSSAYDENKILLTPQDMNFQKDTNTSGITLMDKYLLLQLRPDGEHLSDGELTHGLADAIVGELLLQGVIKLKHKKKSFWQGEDYEWEFTGKNVTPHTSDILEEAVKLMSDKPDKGIVWWMRVLTNHDLYKGVKHLRSRSMASSEQHGLVDTEQKTRLKIFKTEKHHPHDPAYQEQLIRLVREFAQSSVIPPSAHDYGMVALVAALSDSPLSVTVDLKVIFPIKEERKQAKKVMKAYCSNHKVQAE